MKQFRSLVLIAGLLAAMLPVAAQAASVGPLSNEQVIALNKANKLADKMAAEDANRAARCALAAAGAKMPGKVLLANCGGARALQTLPGAAPVKCPVVGRGLNKIELNMVNHYLIIKAKAEKKGDLAPAPRSDIAELIACG